jgi:hypothetical protein
MKISEPRTMVLLHQIREDYFRRHHKRDLRSTLSAMLDEAESLYRRAGLKLKLLTPSVHETAKQ